MGNRWIFRLGWDIESFLLALVLFCRSRPVDTHISLLGFSPACLCAKFLWHHPKHSSVRGRTLSFQEWLCTTRQTKKDCQTGTLTPLNLVQRTFRQCSVQSPVVLFLSSSPVVISLFCGFSISEISCAKTFEITSCKVPGLSSLSILTSELSHRRSLEKGKK